MRARATPRACRSSARWPKNRHLGQHVAAHGRALHGLRLEVHVHQADAAGGVLRQHRLSARAAQASSRAGAGRAAQRPDVVDDVGPLVEAGLHGFGFVGVD